MSTITVAPSAGFCFGVRRAVETAFQYAGVPGETYTLGELIHNPQIVGELAQSGVYATEEIDERLRGRTVIIRSHGVGPLIYQQLEELGCRVVDATCPYVAKIHRIVEALDGNTELLVAGDVEHPEVVGILGYCRGTFQVFKNAEELERIIPNIGENGTKHYVLLSQTTFSAAEWQKCLKIIKKVCTNLEIFATICNATEKRQLQALKMASQSDAMVVVGGRHSSNTKKLVDLCAEQCDTFLVETEEELYQLNLDRYATIGVTAGASTPARIIKEVRKTMSEILKEQDELSFEELLNQSFKTIDNREKVTAVVTGVAPNEISVDIGTKHAGYVPLGELSDDPNARTEDLVKVGDHIDLLVVRVNDVEGTVMLSKKRLDAAAGFEKVMGAADTGEILEGVVVEVIKGGVLVLTNGVKVFIPASQATLSRSDNLEDLLKTKVTFKILEVNRQRKRAVGSIRAVLREQRKELEEQFWQEAEIGKKYTGAVKSLTSYGAFVNLGGVDGMVHISELSWSRIKHPSEVVKVGDMVEVYIKDIDAENKKISLGYKKNDENPWEIMNTKYDVGAVCSVKVVSLTSFGAFAQIIPGVDGLIHISQISNERINQPSDVLKVGQEVEAKITELDIDKKRVSLSIKVLLEEQESVPTQDDGVVYEAGPEA